MTDSSRTPEPTPIDPAIEAALVASREARAQALLDFARIPSISTEPAHAADMVAAADWIVERLQGLKLPRSICAKVGSVRARRCWRRIAMLTAA